MVLTFCGFNRSGNFVLTVDGYNMDECLKHSWHLVYYQVSREPGIVGCNAVAIMHAYSLTIAA